MLSKIQRVSISEVSELSSVISMSMLFASDIILMGPRFILPFELRNRSLGQTIPATILLSDHFLESYFAEKSSLAANGLILPFDSGPMSLRSGENFLADLIFSLLGGEAGYSNGWLRLVGLW